MIARGATQVVYVVAAFQTDRRLVKQGLRELQSANAKVAGVVLNKVDLRRIQHYGYSSYGNGYGDVAAPPRVVSTPAGE
jgi:Mrp family chromosome partitioning ATPase